MALCSKCIIEAVVRSGSAFQTMALRTEAAEADAPAGLAFEFFFVPDADKEDEVVGERSATFEGEIVSDFDEGGVSAVGILRGTFGVDREEIEATAQVETFTRRGETALIQVRVMARERVTFQADLVPSEDGFGGVVYLGWPGGALATSA